MKQNEPRGTIDHGPQKLPFKSIGTQVDRLLRLGNGADLSEPQTDTMFACLFLKFSERFSWIRPFLFRVFFDQLARRTSTAEWWTFMNYGYAEIAGEGTETKVDSGDEPERYCRQLYQRVVTGVDLAGKEVLEVSSGRGGGAAFVCRDLKPRTVTGVDVAPSAVEFCSRTHRLPGLRFLVGDAEHLPIPDQSVDVAINVESSFCYSSIERFFSEVHRVLRPDGCFLYADLRFAEEVDDWLALIRRNGFSIDVAEDITANVARALALDNERRVAANRLLIHWLLRGTLRTFIGAEGTRYPTLLRNGKLRYMRFVLRKAE